ncbi:MAG: peptidoglycan bridge formation protein FemAB [Candidatus Solibacter sp.]|nr:peptidoglycan bridge formation protein FemAB [Candidatus Solibacter sp.]
MGGITVGRFRAGQDEAAWDGYVGGHRLGTPLHLSAWGRVCGRVFGYRNLSLMAWREGKVEGVLPLYLVSNVVTGKILLSSPFAVYGGILGEGEEAAWALRSGAEEMGREHGVQYVELRNWDESQCGGWERVTRYVTFLKQMEEDGQAILEALPRETRRMTRRAVEKGYEIRFTRETAAFEELYAANLRKLGTPAFPSKHFRALMEEYPEADVMELRLEGRMAAAVVSLYHGETVLPYYGASDPEFNRANPNNMMYFGLMREARGRGLKRFDFGRSKKESGAYLFKSHWGMEERELPYEILLVKRKTMPNYSPANPKFGLAIRMWQRAPLKLTRMIGPRLIRLFP